MGKITLGSGSPRRRELLMRLGIDPIIRKPLVDERFNKNLSIEDNAIEISLQKLEYIKKHFPEERWIITADTFIEIDGDILGKPIDRKDAYKMLKRLSNKEHRVLTGVSIYKKDENRVLSEVDLSYVLFKDLSSEDINFYLDKEEWVDAAGAYKIQESGEILIEKINGSFSSIMGLPINKIYGMLKTLNFIYPVI